jgi:hypothetical protein
MGSTDSQGKPYDLDHQLATCIEEYAEDRFAHWERQSDGADWGLQKRLYGHAEEIARLLLEETASLVRSPESDGLDSAAFIDERRRFFRAIAEQRQDIADLLRSKLGTGSLPPVLRAYVEQVGADVRPDDDTLLKLVWERLIIILATDFNGSRLVRGANRLLQLLEIVIEAHPSEATLKFLKRISRCFVFGLDTESVILCRGAIDTAFTHAVHDSMMRELGMEPGARYGYTLAQRIKAARERGLIDESDSRAAARVNGTATDAAHKDPELAANVFAVVRDALRIVRRLNPPI